MASRKTRLVLTLGFVLPLSAACIGGSSGSGGGSGGSSSDDAALNSVDELPQSVSPVEDGSAGSALVAASKALAATGMPLGTTDDDSFNGDSSIAACEMFNQTKHAISAAVQGDLILCYVQNTLAAMDREDLFDGEYHVIGLDFEGSDFEEEEEGAGPGKVKFKVVKDDDGNIVEFEMYSCEDDAQHEYLKQTINGQDFSMVAKHTRDEENASFASSVEVSGKLNSEGAFVDEVDGVATPKTINMTFTHSNEFGPGSFDFTGVMTFEQFSDEARMTGYMNGSHSFEFVDPITRETDTFDCSFTNNIYGAMQLLDANTDDEDYNVNLLALGDGAVLGAFSGGCDGDEWEDDFIEGWFGDSTLPVNPAEDSDFYDDVVDQVLSTPTIETIAFTGVEVYSGCADDSDVEATVSFGDLDVNIAQSCSNLEVDHNHIECWQIVQEGRGGGNDGGPDN